MRDFSTDHRWLSLNTATVRKQGDLIAIAALGGEREQSTGAQCGRTRRERRLEHDRGRRQQDVVDEADHRADARAARRDPGDGVRHTRR